jgi:hypothetical protein
MLLQARSSILYHARFNSCLFFGAIKPYKSGGDEDNTQKRPISKALLFGVIDASAIARMTFVEGRPASAVFR